MKSGVILVNPYYRAESVDFQTSRLKRELSLLGVQVTIEDNGLYPLISDGKISDKERNADFIVYLDKDKYASEMLEKLGYRLFNRHSAIRLCDDKMRTFIALSNSGIPMPKTLPGLLCYSENSEIQESLLDEIERKLGYPVIVKTVYGSCGLGVYKADDRAALKALCEKLKLQPHLFQQCITPSLGSDIRVIVVGGKTVAAMRRTSSTDFRSNIGLGGTGAITDLSPSIAETCIKAAETLGLDFCGIDILTDGDKHYLCEVNSNAFFGGIEKVTKVNVAAHYAKHIYKEIYRDEV